MRRQWPPNNGAAQTPLGAAKNKTEKEGENVDTAEKPHMVKTKKPVNDPEEALLKRKKTEAWKRECPKAREGRRQKPKSGYFCRSFALQATQDDRGPADEAEASPLL